MKSGTILCRYRREFHDEPNHGFVLVTECPTEEGLHVTWYATREEAEAARPDASGWLYGGSRVLKSGNGTETTTHEVLSHQIDGHCTRFEVWPAGAEIPAGNWSGVTFSGSESECAAEAARLQSEIDG